VDKIDFEPLSYVEEKRKKHQSERAIKPHFSCELGREPGCAAQMIRIYSKSGIILQATSLATVSTWPEPTVIRLIAIGVLVTIYGMLPVL